MITNNDETIQITTLTNSGDLIFTPEYLETMKEVSHLTRRFASQLATFWGKEYETLLDYFGPDELPNDLYSGIDGESMNVREDLTDLWDYKEIVGFDGLDGEWYRDIIRAKLASLKVPIKLIKAYIKAAKKAKE